MHNNEVKLTRSALAREPRPLQLTSVFCRRGWRSGNRTAWRQDRDSSRAPTLRRGGPANRRTRYGASSASQLDEHFTGPRRTLHDEHAWPMNDLVSRTDGAGDPTGLDRKRALQNNALQWTKPAQAQMLRH
jgi:hypothetical protein